MKVLILASYVISFVSATLIYFLHLRSLYGKKKSIGAIQAQWSSSFNLSFPMSWLRCGAIFLYFLWCLYQVVVEPGANNGHFSFMLLLIFLSFTPRWNIYFGSKGIVTRMKVIPWTKVSEKKIYFKNGYRYLEIKGYFVPTLSEIKMMKICLPKHVLQVD